MGKVYNYKRVGVRKLAIIVFIISILFLGVFIADMILTGATLSIPSIMIIICSVILLYSAYKKTHTSVGDDWFDIVGKTIRIEQVRRIDIQDKRIDVIVEKGVFILGTHLYMTDKCFDSWEDWNSFKKDMENLKTKLQ